MINLKTKQYKTMLERLRDTAPSMCYWTDFDYDIIDKLAIRKVKNPAKAYMPFFITLDTETSKTFNENAELDENPNYIVTWQMCIYYDDWYNEPFSLVTMYGRRPTELCQCLSRIAEHCSVGNILAYIHNLNYDLVFLRPWFNRFFEHGRNMIIKSHKFLYDSWDIGNSTVIQFRDSLMLYPTKLKKFCEDMKLECPKDGWEYDKIRNQDTPLTSDEIGYMENDVLKLAEALVAYWKTLIEDGFKLNYQKIPYTKTAIPRKKIKKAYDNQPIQDWWEMLPTYEIYELLELIFHGGLTHGNRFYAGKAIKEKGQHLDIKSSYPFVMVACPCPSSKFEECDDDMSTVLSTDIYTAGYIGIFEFHNIELKDKYDPMAILQLSKTVEAVHEHTDNGRILSSSKVTIALTNIDLYDIAVHYKWDSVEILELYKCKLDLLPLWFRNLVFESFSKKEIMEKNSTSYSYQKSLTNSMYGTSVQKYMRDNWSYNDATGEFSKEKITWNDFLNAKSTMAKCQRFEHGIWITAWAQHYVIEMSTLFDTWLYTDTDSCFGLGLDTERLEKINAERLIMLESAGFGLTPNRKNKMSQLGAFDSEDDFLEFKFLGAKRYCQRLEDGLHYTIAGVPKGHDDLLMDNIDNFKKGFVFHGRDTGKKTALHVLGRPLTVDDNNNEVSDFIDLIECDYELDSLEAEILSNKAFYDVIEIYE